MQFNPATNAGSIVARINRLTGQNNTSYPLIDKANDANSALDRHSVIAFENDGSWVFDDTNQSDEPVYKQNLVSGTRKYAIPTSALIVSSCLVKDTSGEWRELIYVNPEETDTNYHAKNILEQPTTDQGGIPTHYTIIGNYLYLDTLPNYNSTDGCKIVLQRGPSYFASSDTTKSPGIPTIHHDFIPLYASMLFLLDKGVSDKYNNVFGQVQILESAIATHFSRRNKDLKMKIKPVWRSSR